MRKVFKLSIIVIIVLSFSSCAIHNGYMNNSVSLSHANFSYTQTSISGTASTLKFLGIGGLEKSAIVEEAKKDMLKKYPLKSNHALTNITVNWKSGFYFIVMTNQCTVTADIVRFYNADESRDVEAENIDVTQKKSIVQTKFVVGEKVRYKDTFKSIEGVIIKIEGYNYFVKYTDKKGKEKTMKVSEAWLSSIE